MRSSLLAALIALLAFGQAAMAETPEQQAEKQALKACEAKICDLVSTMDPGGEDITCNLAKTWREDEIAKAVGKRINWPWGSAKCQSQVTLERGPLAKALSEKAYEITMPVQTARCVVGQKKGGDPYVLEFSATPKLRFENGKATEVQANWGKMSVPTVVYPLFYASTALDNSTNVLGPELVRLVNDFTRKKCGQVKAALP